LRLDKVTDSLKVGTV